MFHYLFIYELYCSPRAIFVSSTKVEYMEVSITWSIDQWMIILVTIYLSVFRKIQHFIGLYHSFRLTIQAIILDTSYQWCHCLEMCLASELIKLINKELSLSSILLLQFSVTSFNKSVRDLMPCTANNSVMLSTRSCSLFQSFTPSSLLRMEL